jgi:hypothetical protein
VTTIDCAREREVADALRRGWFDDPAPAGEAEAAAELRAHADGCEVCGDVVLVARMLQAERDVARLEVQVPAAGQVWWRAAIRARLEATHAAARPMTWVHGVAAACGIGLAAGLLRLAWPAFEAAGMSAGESAARYVPVVEELGRVLAAAMQRSLPFALLAATCLVLAPIALYLALSDE